MMADGRRVRVADDVEELAVAAAELVVATLGRALRRRGIARWVLAGGTTPTALYRLLGTRHRDSLDWSRVRFFWGDERAVPPDHEDSNYGSARALLLSPLGVAAHQISRIRGEVSAIAAAGEYDLSVARALVAGDWDLLLLGLGADGHTASLFPPASRHLSPDGWAIATEAPSSPRERVSLSLRALNRSRQVLFLVAGRDKAEAVRRVLAADIDLPASLVSPAGDRVEWYLDRAAASEVRGLEPSAAVQSDALESPR
jgi:6-phosphogluconolactonase